MGDDRAAIRRRITNATRSDLSPSGGAPPEPSVADGTSGDVGASNPQRGKVTKITFEIEYPDGSTKIGVIDDAQTVTSIAFDEASVPDSDRHRFNVSNSDWRENPAMVVYRGRSIPVPHCFVDIHLPFPKATDAGGIP